MNIEALSLVSDVDVSDGYKYLGILQDLLISHQIVKDNVISEYRSRLQYVLSSHLNGHYKIIAINSYAIPVLRYSVLMLLIGLKLILMKFTIRQGS